MALGKGPEKRDIFNESGLLPGSFPLFICYSKISFNPDCKIFGGFFWGAKFFCFLIFFVCGKVLHFPWKYRRDVACSFVCCKFRRGMNFHGKPTWCGVACEQHPSSSKEGLLQMQWGMDLEGGGGLLFSCCFFKGKKLSFTNKLTWTVIFDYPSTSIIIISTCACSHFMCVCVCVYWKFKLLKILWFLFGKWNKTELINLI